MDVVKLLCSFQGRIGRGQFWLAVLIYAIVYAVAAAIGFAIDSMSALMGAILIAAVPCTLSGVFVGIKRLRDRNKSAWWLVVFYGLPFVLPFVAPSLGADDGDSTPVAATILQYVGLAVSLWGLVELGAIRGTIGSNPYGPDPVAPKPAQH